MRKQFLKIGFLCAVCSGLALAVHAGSQRQQAARERLQGAEVKSASGHHLGYIDDVLVNPSSGKIDFAVVTRGGPSPAVWYQYYALESRWSSSAVGHTQNTGTSAGVNAGGNIGSQGSGNGVTLGDGSTLGTVVAYRNNSSDRLVPVPWSLLQASASYGELPVFVLRADRTKFDNAPSVARGSWHEINQPQWWTQIYSYYGVSSTSAMGGAESPSGTSSGSGSGY